MSLFGNISNIALFLLILFLFVVCLKIYMESDAYNLKCILSDVDGKRYCVRDRQKLQIAADMLATTAQKCKDLVAYCVKKYPDNPDVQRLAQKFNPTTLSETLPTSQYTAYSENKGEKLAFCLDKYKNTNKMIDQDTLTFVAIHELAHIMTVSEGHLREFWTHFKFLLVAAKEAGIYEPVDYKANPQPYCGMTITDNPYYDFN